MKLLLKSILISVIQIISFVLFVSLISCFYSLLIGYESSYQRGLFFQAYVFAYSVIVLLMNLIFSYTRLRMNSLSGYLILLGSIIILAFIFMDSIVCLPLSSLLVFGMSVLIYGISSVLVAKEGYIRKLNQINNLL